MYFAEKTLSKYFVMKNLKPQYLLFSDRILTDSHLTQVAGRVPSSSNQWSEIIMAISHWFRVGFHFQTLVVAVFALLCTDLQRGHLIGWTDKICFTQLREAWFLRDLKLMLPSLVRSSSLTEDTLNAFRKKSKFLENWIRPCSGTSPGIYRTKELGNSTVIKQD